MPTLGTHMRERRAELSITQTAAAKMAGVSRTSWSNWESDSAEPERFNWTLIERVLRWEPRSVASIRAGGEPSPIPDGAPAPPAPVSDPTDVDDQTILDLKAAAISDDLRQMLIANYRAELARERALREREDEERRQRYLKIAEAANG